jgi:hypothetical protein
MFCPDRVRDGVQLRCRYNGQTIQVNATDGKCPHPDGGRFVAVVGDGGPTVEKVGAVLAANPMGIIGPLLWRQIHNWTLTANLKADRDYINLNILPKIPCGDCKTHAQAWLKANPPDFTSYATLFAWGNRFHNSVNERLGKRQWNVEEALKRWGQITGGFLSGE